jgi:hypothetical protein
MENNQSPQISIFSSKVLEGLRIATANLVKKRAAKNGSLVIMVDGKVKSVPAKDLLPLVEKDQHANSELD